MSQRAFVIMLLLDLLVAFVLGFAVAHLLTGFSG